jgi:trigger factor
LKIDVKNVESYKKKIRVEVSPEEVHPHLEKAYLKYQQKVKIDGFRKGKVPLSLIKKRFGAAIEADLADDLVQQFYQKCLDQEGIIPVAPGKITELTFKEGGPLSFSAEVEVEPEITVEGYRGIKVEKEIVPVTDEDVQSMLEYLREQRAEREVVEGGALTGNLLEADIQALDATGFPIIGQKWEKRILELGLPPFGPDVVQQLTGIRAGEERRIRIPKQEPKKDGPSWEQFLLHVHQVFEKKLPVLDDDFAKKLGEYENLEQLKVRLKENLTAQREQDSEKAVRHQLSQEIVKRNDYTLPPAQVEFMLESMFEEEQKAGSETDKDQFLQRQRPMVVWSLKWNRIWHKIIENESISVSDDMIQAEIDRMAGANPAQEKKIQTQFKQESGRNRIREHLLEEKLFEFLKAEAKIKEIQVKQKKNKKSSIITS